MTGFLIFQNVLTKFNSGEVRHFINFKITEHLKIYITNHKA